MQAVADVDRQLRGEGAGENLGEGEAFQELFRRNPSPLLSAGWVRAS